MYCTVYNLKIAADWIAIKSNLRSALVFTQGFKERVKLGMGITQAFSNTGVKSTVFIWCFCLNCAKLNISERGKSVFKVSKTKSCLVYDSQDYLYTMPVKCGELKQNQCNLTYKSHQFYKDLLPSYLGCNGIKEGIGISVIMRFDYQMCWHRYM